MRSEKKLPTASLNRVLSEGLVEALSKAVSDNAASIIMNAALVQSLGKLQQAQLVAEAEFPA